MRISDSMGARRPFEAVYAFQCACCNTWYDAGTLAKYIEQDQLVNADPNHDDTTGYEVDGPKLSEQKIEVMPHGKKASDRCDRCFMVHATNQIECE